MIRLKLQSVVVKQLNNSTATLLNVSQRSGEVVVHRNHVAGLDERACDHVLGSATLVYGKKILLAQNIKHSLLQTLERLRAGIGIVGVHHSCELVVAHSVGAAIGKHIEEYIAGAQTEGIETSLLHRLETTLDGYEVELLYDANFMKFKRNIASSEEFYIAHNDIFCFNEFLQ